MALVDLTDEEIKRYLPAPAVGVPPSSVVRFQKMPFKVNPKDNFYFSNSFNDYYKMDFKEFIKRMPVLKAKKRCESAKLSNQIRESRKRSYIEDQKREMCKNQMMDILNNLYIERQYLSLSLGANNIQPLMSSIHAQVYPGREDESTRRTKMYIKSDKPLGSERNVDDIDFTVNERDYHRKEIKRLKSSAPRAKSAVRRLNLPKYDLNDPDVAIFKKIEILDKFMSESNKPILIKDKGEKSSVKLGAENKKEEENKENESQNKIGTNTIEEKIKAKKILTNAQNQNQKNRTVLNTHDISKRRIQSSKIRALSANKIQKKKNLSNINNNRALPRTMSAHSMRPTMKQNNEYYIHKVFLSSRNKLDQRNRVRKNRLNDLFDENRKGNNSSQVSTYDEGINSLIYENQSVPRYGFPYKTSHQIENKIYLKINNRIKERQYEKAQQKLEQFSNLIRLDDTILSDDVIKEK